MSDDPQMQLQALQDKLSDIQEKAHLGDKHKEAERISDHMGDIAKALDDLQSENYAFTAPLRARLDALQTQWNAIRANLDAQYTHYQHFLGHEAKRASGLLDNSQKSGSGEDPLAVAEGMFSALEDRIEDVAGQFDDWMQPFSSALYAIETQIRRIKWSLEHWSETVADVAPGENLHLAADAEWVVSGRDKDDPDGILFLTDQHLIFEQKEKKGGMLGMGGKQVHELEWVAPLASLTEARAESKGMFGGKDMLHLTFSNGDIAEATLEIKGGIDSKVWQAYLEQVKSSGTIFSDALDEDLPTVPQLTPEQIATAEEAAKDAVKDAAQDISAKASDLMASHGVNFSKKTSKPEAATKAASAGELFSNKPKDAKQDPKADVLKQFRAKSAADDDDDEKGNVEHNPFANRKPPQK